MVAGKLKNCPECGKLFMDMGTRICRDCLDKEEELMMKISSFVRDNPHSTIKEIVDGVEGAKEKVVRRMIKEGRFVQDGVEIEYPCEKCGKLIHHGRFCPKCDEALKKDMVKVQQKAVEKAVAAVKERKPMGTGFRSKGMGQSTK